MSDQHKGAWPQFDRLSEEEMEAVTRVQEMLQEFPSVAQFQEEFMEFIHDLLDQLPRPFLERVENDFEKGRYIPSEEL